MSGFDLHERRLKDGWRPVNGEGGLAGLAGPRGGPRGAGEPGEPG